MLALDRRGAPWAAPTTNGSAGCLVHSIVQGRFAGGREKAALQTAGGVDMDCMRDEVGEYMRASDGRALAVVDDGTHWRCLNRQNRGWRRRGPFCCVSIAGPLTLRRSACQRRQRQRRRREQRTAVMVVCGTRAVLSKTTFHCNYYKTSLPEC